MKTSNSILRFFGRKLAVVLLITGTAAGAFATLGDGNTNKSKPSLKSKSLLSNKTQANSFSLRSTYSFRGTQVINTDNPKYINVNTVFTYQRGNASYVMPMKKKVLLENVKIDLSNRQLRRN